MPLVVKVKVYGPSRVKAASTDLSSSMVKVWGVTVPVRPPLKPVKELHAEALAQMVTTTP